MWTEHRNPEGRTYWFNTSTKQSVWEKPDELKTPFERALNQTKWKEYFSGGRKYYYNTESKESKWDMPDELLLLLEKVEKEASTAAPTTSANGAARAITAPGFTPVNNNTDPGHQNGVIALPGSAPATATTITSTPTTTALSLALSTPIPTPTPTPLPLRPNPSSNPNLPEDPVIPHNGFQTLEEGEKAFTHLLRKAGVDANWTWDQTMRAIITDPLYRALNSLAEKKGCWEKYTTSLKQKEIEEKEARLAKLRPAIRNMLKGNPNVFHYTTFGTADKLFAMHPIWQQAKVENERRLIFEGYVGELREKEVNETRATRTASITKVVSLFKRLEVDVLTRWRDAYERLTLSEEWSEDEELRKLPSLDILLAFEDYSRVREREYEEVVRRRQVEKTRKERRGREGFRELIQELIGSGKIKARTKWKEVYPVFKDDVRYLDMLGNPGSNALELFWDVVDGFDQKLDRKIGVVEEAMKKVNNEKMDVGGGGGMFEVTALMSWEEFVRVIGPEVGEGMEEVDLRMVYKTMHDAAVKKQADEKRRAERKQRHLQDDLRYAMKKMQDVLDVGMKYEEVVPLIEHLPEFKALEDDEGRKVAFAKFVKRQKERMRETGSEDGGSTTSRKRKEPHRERDDEGRDRDRERERDRDRDRDRDKRDREKDGHRDRKEYDRSGSGRSSRHHHSSRYDVSSTKYHRERGEKRTKRDDDSKRHGDHKEDTPEEGEI